MSLGMCGQSSLKQAWVMDKIGIHELRHDALSVRGRASGIASLGGGGWWGSCL